MNDNRMDPRERSRYWTRHVSVPAGAVIYMAVAEPRWLVIGYLVMVAGILQFIYSERPSYEHVGKPVFVAMIATAMAVAIVEPMAGAMLAAAMLAWRFHDYRRGHAGRGIPALLRTDRGQVYLVVAALLAAGVILTIIRTYAPLAEGTVQP